jgi:hypothetical protein
MSGCIVRGTERLWKNGRHDATVDGEVMICQGCRAGADNMTDYRRWAREDDERRAMIGEKPMSIEAARKWLRVRARWAMSLHCLRVREFDRRKLVPGCTCQCLIPELNEQTEVH